MVSTWHILQLQGPLTYAVSCEGLPGTKAAAHGFRGDRERLRRRSEMSTISKSGSGDISSKCEYSSILLGTDGKTFTLFQSDFGGLDRRQIDRPGYRFAVRQSELTEVNRWASERGTDYRMQHVSTYALDCEASGARRRILWHVSSHSLSHSLYDG